MQKSQSHYLVTGANSQLGRALVNYICKLEGISLFITSRSRYNFGSILERKNVKYLPGIDLTVASDLEHLSSEVDSFFAERINIIHSVGDFWYHVPFSEIGITEAKQMMESHYLTLYGVAHSLIPVMIRKGGGSMIAFSCNSVRYNYPHMAAFSSAKAAVESLVKCLANEYSKDNINANVIQLSSLQTDKVKHSKPFGDYHHFIPIEELAVLIKEINNPAFKLLSGNVINLFKYSPSFFNEGYFQRNRVK